MKTEEWGSPSLASVSARRRSGSGEGAEQRGNLWPDAGGEGLSCLPVPAGDLHSGWGVIQSWTSVAVPEMRGDPPQ